MSKGTVGAVALDAHGTLACATSTGGKTNKNVGRIGDTPSMGSGFWASTWPSRPTLWERLGINIFSSAASSIARHDGVAISGTGDGDFFVRNAATHEVVSRMKYLGEPVKQASHGVVDYLKTQNGMGGMIAVDSHGNCKRVPPLGLYLVCLSLTPSVFHSERRHASELLGYV